MSTRTVYKVVNRMRRSVYSIDQELSDVAYPIGQRVKPKIVGTPLFVFSDPKYATMEFYNTVKFSGLLECEIDDYPESLHSVQRFAYAEPLMVNPNEMINSYYHICNRVYPGLYGGIHEFISFVWETIWSACKEIDSLVESNKDNTGSLNDVSEIKNRWGGKIGCELLPLIKGTLLVKELTVTRWMSFDEVIQMTNKNK